MISGSVARIAAQDPGVTLIGVGSIPGTSLDKSGLAGQTICQRDDLTICIDQAQMGGLGSGVTYTGWDNVFLATPDRGPFDGRTNVPYLDRVQVLEMTVNPKAAFPNIKTKVLDTRLLVDERGRSFVGDAFAFDPDPKFPRRFDPEAVVVGLLGNFYVSDEYGPYINEFDRRGRLLRRIRVPEKFRLDPEAGHPTGDVDGDGNSFELYPSFNIVGRQANRGMEGLAITPNGRFLVGIMQNALLQDHAVAPTPTSMGRVGFNNRILTIDLLTGKTREYVYVMDAINQGRGVNEILAINDHEFLVLERDNRSNRPTPPNTAAAPNLKRLYKIDLDQPNLTDVSDVDSLPQGALPSTIVPVAKTLFLDLLNPAYKVSATETIKDVVAEKIEGLAWGPALKDGRPVLYVLSDNDLSPGLPTQIYAFAIDEKTAHIDYRRQFVLFPFLTPLERLKALFD